MVAKVYLWNSLVGAVLWDPENDYARFEFDSEFLNRHLDIAPLRMPLDEILGGKRIFSFPELSKETYKGLPGLLADSLPDKFGNRLIDAWLARQGRDSDSFDPVERLCYTGKRGMGALEFEPAAHAEDPSESIEVHNLVALAKEVLSERSDMKTNIHKKADGLLEIIKVGTSAGGSRAKAIIAYDEKSGNVRSGQVETSPEYTYWIIKFDGVTNKELGDPEGYGKIEYAYYKMALDAGIIMPECRIFPENDRVHFMSKRFDRKDGYKKIHVQTLCALAHFDYNDPDAYSYEQAFQVMRQLRLPYSDAVQLYIRMVFNVIARNQDDHTKNISFLMEEDGKWKLAPAYDVTYAFDPTNRWFKHHQLSINGKRDDIAREDLLILAKEMNIKKPKDIIEKVKHAVSQWKRHAKDADVPKDQFEAIARTHLLNI
jgi:serine/threonine-protein kinase HipA